MVCNSMDVLTEEWIALALLHKEHPQQQYFTIEEFDERVEREFNFEPDIMRLGHLIGSLRQGVGIANKARPHYEKPVHRYFFEPTPGRIRLFRLQDPVHPTRSEGKICPGTSELPESYRYLLPWHQQWIQAGL